MGVEREAFGIICAIFVGIAAVAAPLIALYVFRRTKDHTMKKDNALYLINLFISFRMTFWLVLMGIFCMWIMWACTFMHQMYPLTRLTTK